MKILTNAFCIFMMGCSSLSHSEALYGVFEIYKSSATKDNILTKYVEFYSPQLVEEGPPDESAIPFLLFKDKMAKEREHYEKFISDSEGCLTVEGVDNEKGDPIEFNIKYIKVKDKWFMDESHIRFLESEKEYSNSAKCPHEVR